MDGRLVTVLATLVLPVILIGVTYAEFHSNPLAILGLIVVMLIGSFYLLSYREAF
ncbi:MAG: hypothetical protein L3K04_05495 [Thermoplasmata archaeon]|nr:hypothetical protein [Thermoplasmata archaeon]MCI4337867.1 hypothetical protein [Thermoplasmata archaeon]MCI4341165.1 hypothetical protein [Thermoplasmata archaeon]